VDHPSPARELTIENTGRMAVASGGDGKPDAMKLEFPPQAPEELLPMVLLQEPMPPVTRASAPVETPDGGVKPGSPATVSEELPTAAPLEPPVLLVPRLKPDAVPVEKTDVGVKPAALPKIPGELPPAAPVEPPVPLLLLGPLLPFVPPLPPVKPDSNFSDNPD